MIHGKSAIMRFNPSLANNTWDRISDPSIGFAASREESRELLAHASECETIRNYPFE
jgi:hypothetical protein